MPAHRTSTRSSRRVLHVAVAAVASLAGANAAADYPPPPGAYRSDPAYSAGASTLAAPAEVKPDPSGSGSGQLPAPDSSSTHEPGTYDATRLFGAQNKPAVQVKPAERTQDRAPPVFAPAVQPASPPPREGFSVDSRRADTAQTRATPYRAQGAAPRPSYPGYAPPYPQYAPAYPAYPPYSRPATGQVPTESRRPSGQGADPVRPEPTHSRAAAASGGFRDAGSGQDKAPSPSTAIDGRTREVSHADDYRQGSPPAADERRRQAVMPATGPSAGPAYAGTGKTPQVSAPTPGEDAIFRPPSL